MAEDISFAMSRKLNRQLSKRKKAPRQTQSATLGITNLLEKPLQDSGFGDKVLCR